ncbi:MAG TPA: serine hydrolase [Chloroflexota bacterium]|nr:serine hydrolase [Chloroflexota bacterium]
MDERVDAATTNVVSEIRQLFEKFSGRAGFFARDLNSDRTLSLRPRDTFPTASMIKLPILVELFWQVQNGQQRLADEEVISGEAHVGGSGILRHLTPGIRLPVRDVAHLMMSVSDNTATNLLIDRVGFAAVNKRMRVLGCPGLVLHRKINFNPEPGAPKYIGTGNPEEFVGLLEKVWRKEILNPAACEEMIRMMDGVGSERAGRYLAINPYAEELGDADAEERVFFVGKTGAVNGVRGQVAIVSGKRVAFSLAIMTEDCQDLSWSVDNEGNLLAARLGKLLFDYFRG